MKRRLNQTLIINTLQKEYRNHTLIFLLGLSLLLIYAINGLMDFFGGGLAPAEAKLAILYRIISAWGGLLGLLLGSGCLSSDRTSGVMPIILALPVSRAEYLLARVVGTWLIVLGYYALSLLLGFVVFSIGSGALALNLRVLAAFAINAGGILAAILLGLLCSLFLSRTKAFLASLATTACCLAAGSALAGLSLAEQFSSLSLSRGLALGLHYLLPRLGSVSTLAQGVLFNRSCELNAWLETLHFGLSLSLLAGLCLMIFKRQDL